MKHINIPVFVPHIGCPHDCAFCDQKTITGHEKFDIEDAKKEIENFLSGANTALENIEIAFFGGSFTGIGEPLMSDLLDLAKSYVDTGRISSIRLSTRPDYITREILDTLKKYPVKTIELGIQSISDRVLKASHRGHSALDCENACRLIKEYGFSLVGQMMIGLPLSTPDDEIKTAEFIVKMGADAARIYPTVVFAGTGLEAMIKSGEYTPLTPESAAERAAKVYSVFNRGSVTLLRIGLCESDGLRSGKVVAGAYHPALGEICLSEYYKDRICSEIESLGDIRGKSVIIHVKKGRLSTVIGQKGYVRAYLYKKYLPSFISICENDHMTEGEVKITLKESDT